MHRLRRIHLHPANQVEQRRHNIRGLRNGVHNPATFQAEETEESKKERKLAPVHGPNMARAIANSRLPK